MTINPVHLNGTMQRSQDVGAMRHKELQKPVVQQENIQTTFQRRTENMVKTVTNPNQKNGANGHFDAKEEGKNKYFSSRKKNENQKYKDQVTEKKQTFGFDVTI